MSEKTVYVRIRQEQFAEEFLENCVIKTGELYGLTRNKILDLIERNTSNHDDEAEEER